jgi:hypothetical protein
MRVRISCSTEHAVDAARSLETWLQAVEAGEYDGDQMVVELNNIMDDLMAQKAAVVRALGH